MSFNRVVLLGNLTRDVEVRYLTNKTAVAELGIAVNRRWKDASGEQKEETTFIDCTVWSKTAETIAKYFSKGDPILLEGRLTLDSWADKTSGEKRTKLKVTIENFSFVGAGKGGDKTEKPKQGEFDPFS